MNEVTLAIGRRNYTVACADGQEAHVRAMGVEVDERLRRLGANLSSNDAKNLLFAALILADELYEHRQQESRRSSEEAHGSQHELAEAREQVARLEEELTDALEEQERLRQHLANANERLARQEDAADGLDEHALTMRLENLADALEKSALVLEHIGEEA